MKLLKFLVGWPLSILALFFLWRIFTPHLGAIGINLTHANFFVLFLSLCAFQAYFLFRVFLWKTILKAKGYDIPLKKTAWYWSIAEINRYIPGNIWSIVGRSATFGTFGIKQSTLLFAWAQESILILLGSSLVGLFGLGHVFYILLPNFPLKGALYWTVIIVVLLIAIVFVLQQQVKKLLPFPVKVHTHLSEPSVSFRQLLLSLFAFFFFGVGTYLSITSLFYVPFQQVDLFIGLFSLSYMIGYVSFITPMGLGVREFIISGGLLPFLARSIVGLVALFSRFFLVVSELVFLLLAFIFSEKFSQTISHLIRDSKNRLRIKSIVTSRIKHLQKYSYEYFLGVSVVTYIAYFATASFLRYTNFFTGRFDLGNMDQTVWNTIHGKIFMLTDPNGTNSMSRLGTHADFILILLAPFYLLWEDPRMLLFLQTLVVAFGAVFVYLLAKDILKQKSAAYVVSLAYLLNPSIQYANLYDFHPVTLATTFFLGAWYCVQKKRYIWMLFFLLLAGLTKEEAWIVVGLFGVYIFLFKQRKLFGLLLSVLSFTTFYLLVWKLIPLARGGQHFALSYYSDFGVTPTGIIKNIIFSPVKTFFLLITFSKIVYLLQLLLPLGFVSLLAPQFLIFALPDLGINLLSNNAQLQQISFQYTAVISPFLFIATIYAVAFLRKRYRRVSLFFVACFLLFFTLLSAYLYGPLPGAQHPDIDMFVHQEDDRAILQNFLQDIPSSFSVAASNNVGSHLSHRQKIYTIPVGIDKADIVVFLLNDAFAQPSLAEQKKMAEKMKHDKNYIEVFKENDFVVFEKRSLYTKKEPTLQKGKLYPAAIQTLEKRDYEGGDIHVQKVMQNGNTYKSILFSYPSDGLTLYARADMPSRSNGPFPVVIINRGFLFPSSFNEQTSYQNISQTFAKSGFIAITPDYRNNGQSDTDRSIAGILGYPIDVLNLLSSLKNLPQANSTRVFLWGYSTGGQVTLSTLAAVSQNNNITPKVRAASVWAPVVDQYTTYLRLHKLFPNKRVPYQAVMNAFGTFTKNPLTWESVSPLYYLDDITTPVRVSHGLSDSIAPYEGSIELYNSLNSFHSNAQIALYQNTDHNFTITWKQAVQDDIRYFQTFLR